jgi:hypothetical protein
LARKDRNLAGFGDLANDDNNTNNAANDNVKANHNVNNDNQENPNTVKPDYLDKLLDEATKKKDDLVLIGVYVQPHLEQILSRLGKKGGRGAKSRIVNDALKKMFEEKGLL